MNSWAVVLHCIAGPWNTQFSYCSIGTWTCMLGTVSCAVGKLKLFVLFVCCLTSQQHPSVSQGQICTDNFMCCHTEIEVADQTFYLTQSQYTDTGPTIPSADPIMPGPWQDSHWSANFEVTGMTRPGKILSQAGSNPRSSVPEADALTIRTMRRSVKNWRIMPLSIIITFSITMYYDLNQWVHGNI